MTHFETDLAETQASMRRLIGLFALTMLVLVAGVGGWAVASKVDSAVVASGTFAVTTNGQAVQHLHGGVVGQILVKEGDKVAKGQLIIKLDAAKVHAELGILDRRLVELTAERARLSAERDGRAIISQSVLNGKTGTRARALRVALTAQQALLTTRQSTLQSQLAQLHEQTAQISSSIRGITALKRARQSELGELKADYAAYAALDKKRLIRRSILRQSKRQVSRTHGDILEIESRLLGLRSKRAEVTFRVSEIERKSRTEILDRLRVVTAELGATLEKHIVAKDRFARLEIRAPSAGFVHELKAHTVGGVIGPGNTVMTIIPYDAPLIVVAQIKPSEVDQVRLGQEAMVRISAFDNQASPELDGTVIAISPDRSIDERSGHAYFKVRISVAPGQEAKLGGKQLGAGLPAEVFIRGKARRVISYLTQPLRDQMGLAFREE